MATVAICGMPELALSFLASGLPTSSVAAAISHALRKPTLSPVRPPGVPARMPTDKLAEVHDGQTRTPLPLWSIKELPDTSSRFACYA